MKFTRASTWLIGLCATVVCAGCTSASIFSRGDSQQAQRIRILEKELRAKQAKIEELKERNMVLERKARPKVQRAGGVEVPVPFHPSAARETITEADSSSAITAPASVSSRAVPAVDSKRTELVKPSSIPGVSAPRIEKVGSAETGEHFLYSKVIETYRKRNFAELQKSLRLLLKTYPDSVFADNALYLTGLLALETEDTARAEAYMDQILREYPGSNKAVSALFAKGIIEKRSKHFNQAKQIFERVRKMYPGSPEAARVALEIKLLKTSAGQRREL